MTLKQFITIYPTGSAHCKICNKLLRAAFNTSLQAMVLHHLRTVHKLTKGKSREVVSFK